MILDHNMERLAEGAATGCHMCTMILSNLTRTGFSADGLPPQLGDSMYVKIWHDRSVDFFTGDQRDEIRFDATCLGQIARLEVKSIAGRNLKTLQTVRSVFLTIRFRPIG